MSKTRTVQATITTNFIPECEMTDCSSHGDVAYEFKKRGIKVAELHVCYQHAEWLAEMSKRDYEKWIECDKCDCPARYRVTISINGANVVAHACKDHVDYFATN